MRNSNHMRDITHLYPRPEKLNSETCSIGSESNFRSGIKVSILRCWWWKIKNFVLLTLTDNLFISNHSCTWGSSSLMLFVTSVKLVGFSEFEELNEHMGLRRFFIIRIKNSFKIWCCNMYIIHIYIIITKILRWNRGFWCSLNNT